MADEETENQEEQTPEAEAAEGDEKGVELDEFDQEDAPSEAPANISHASDLEAVYDIPVQISAVLGKAQMPVNQLLKLGRGAVVELDRKVGESIDIYVNNRLVARGELVIVDDRLGITMTEIIKSSQNI